MAVASHACVGLAPGGRHRDTRLLVLGSFPSVASLAAAQYYAHPRNQFWPILSALWGVDLRALPYAAAPGRGARRGLGLWDVYAQLPARRQPRQRDRGRRAQRPGRPAAPGAALARDRAQRRRVGARDALTRGARRCEVVRLPSTSPANASWSLRAQARGLARGLRARTASCRMTACPKRPELRAGHDVRARRRALPAPGHALGAGRDAHRASRSASSSSTCSA